MKKITLYSSSRSSRPRAPVYPSPVVEIDKTAQTHESVAGEPGGGARRLRWKNFFGRHRPLLWLAAYALVGAVLLASYAMIAPPAREITPEEIRGAVLHVLDTETLPSPAAKAYEAVRRSVVRVRGLGHNEKGGEDIERSVGTGVVIVNKGLILTNLHVVADAERVQVVFADGSESEATVTGIRPEHDLAVLQAQKVPADLPAATMASTAELRMGDRVFAVGFPFGIGPSLTAGVISGLQREFRSPQGKRLLTNLIQFDAAVNPGSSGGPLVTAKGEVVGVVTGILNPTEQRVFVGIGFAVPIENAAAAAGIPPF
ncbi:MAG TPA: trypsin-like peptidase domain-containing protein [Candidatus Binatia bacterium]